MPPGTKPSAGQQTGPPTTGPSPTSKQSISSPRWSYIRVHTNRILRRTMMISISAKTAHACCRNDWPPTLAHLVVEIDRADHLLPDACSPGEGRETRSGQPQPFLRSARPRIESYDSLAELGAPTRAL